MVISSMAALAHGYPYLLSSIKYHLLSLHYDVHTIYIGDRPYPDFMWPEYPAAFSYCRGCKMPPSVSQLARFMRQSPRRTDEVLSMFSNSWSMLTVGVAFFNADYIPGDNSDNCDMLGMKAVVRMDQVSHFISGYVLRDVQSHTKISIVGVGRYGRMVAREVRTRLRMRNVDINVLGMMQPVSALKQGWTDSEVSMGEQSIFDSEATHGELVKCGMMYGEMMRSTTLDEILSGYRNKLSGCTLLTEIMSDAVSKSVSNIKAKRETWRKAKGGAKLTAQNALLEELAAHAIVCGEALLKGSRTTSSYDSVVATSTSTMRRVGVQQRKMTKAPATKRTISDKAQCRVLDDMQSTDDESMPIKATEEQPPTVKCEEEVAPEEVESAAGDVGSETDGGESGDESGESGEESGSDAAPATSPTAKETFNLGDVTQTPTALRDSTPPKAPTAEGIRNSPLAVADAGSTPAKKDSEAQLKTPGGSGNKREGEGGGSKRRGSGRKDGKGAKSPVVGRIVL